MCSGEPAVRACFISESRPWCLRNIFYSEYRKRRREVADVDGVFSAKLTCAPEQQAHLELLEFRKALQRLPADQREALILVGASGLSYEEAARICDCPIGTIKSRVNRARNRLGELLQLEGQAGVGPSEMAQAA